MPWWGWLLIGIGACGWIILGVFLWHLSKIDLWS
jgi:hypothetical protein